MIDHKVIIGTDDVSQEVIKISTQQSLDTDSDPGKITVILANPFQKYTNKWPPQKTPIKIIVYNWVYYSEAERAIASGGPQKEYLVATGHLTALKATADEATVLAECDLGHLADALPKDHEGLEMPISAKECLTKIISWHTDEPITLVWDPELKDKQLDKITYNSDNTYQDVCEDIAAIVGAIYYFGEDNVLNFKDPTSNNGLIPLDPFVTNPEQTFSLTNFRNIVIIIGNQSLAADGNGNIDPNGATTPGSEPIIGYAEDPDSIDEVGPLQAPAEYAYNIKSQAEADARAKQRLEFYKMYKNAETTVQVAGIVPPLQSIVTYTPFEPISNEDLARANAIFAARAKLLQEQENSRALAQSRPPEAITITNEVRGIVIAKKVEDSIEGLTCDLTLSPGMLDIETPITNEDIDDGEGGEGQQYPIEDE
jgi:hypothetical protein